MPKGHKSKTTAPPEETPRESVLTDDRAPAEKKVKITKAAPAQPEDKKQIGQYKHDDKKRCNNPPIGLVRAENDPEDHKKTTSTTPTWTLNCNGLARQSTRHSRSLPFPFTSMNASILIPSSMP